MSAASQPHIVVVGSGVIGLSTAVSLLDSPLPMNVTLVSSHFPTDKDNRAVAPAEYASVWAGAHHVSSPSSERELKWDKETMSVFRALQQQHTQRGNGTGTRTRTPSPLVWVRQSELFATPPNNDTEKWTRSALDMYECGAGTGTSTGAGHTLFKTSPSLPVYEERHFNTIDINVPVYLSMLFSRFSELGGRTVRRRVRNVKEAVQLATNANRSQHHPVSAVFLTPGLGIRDFSDIPTDEREKTYPVRGQTVLVHAPWLRLHDALATEQSPTWAGLSRTNEKGERDLYIIPRGDGHFIVGGTRLPHDDDARPRKETTTSILTRALELCPLLASPSSQVPSIPPRAQDVYIVGVNVGLRPARKGGPVLCEWTAEKGRPCDQKVILGYGFGGYGYQNSWGVAFEARQLLLKALNFHHAIPDEYRLKSLEQEEKHLPAPNVEHLWRRARM